MATVVGKEVDTVIIAVLDLDEWSILFNEETYMQY